MAALLLAFDAWRIASHIVSLAGVRIALVALAVVAAGGLLVVGVAWLAGSGPRGLRAALITAVVVLVVVRVVIMLAYDGIDSGEPGVYDRLARRLASGECCPWDTPVDRPPGYTVVLAIAYALAGPSPAVVEALNFVFAIATGGLVLALGRHFYGPAVGAVALLLYALWPAGALMIVVSIPHSIYDLVFVAAAWAVVAAPRDWRWSTLAGVLLGISQYFRPTTWLLLPFFILARVWKGGRWRDLLTGSVAPMVLGFLLVLVPIMAWHLSTRGVLDISTSSAGGRTFYHGTNPVSGGRWSRAASLEIDRMGDSLWEQTQAAQAAAIARIRDDPVGMAALALRKQVTLWGRETYGVRYGIRRELAAEPWRPPSVLPTLASGTFYAALLAFTTLGLYLRRRHVDELIALALLVVLALSLLHGLVEVRDRYRSYAIPLLMPIAALAIVELAAAVRRRLGPRPPPEQPQPPEPPEPPDAADSRRGADPGNDGPGSDGP